MSDTFGIHFGALAPPLREQMKEQGVPIDDNAAEHLERDIDAVNRLRVRGLLPDSQAHKVHQKIMRKIEQQAREALK